MCITRRQKRNNDFRCLIKDIPTATYAPKKLKWDEITISDQWKTEITQPLRNFKQEIFSKIIEQRNVKIVLHSGSFKEPLPPRITLYHSRASFLNMAWSL